MGKSKSGGTRSFLRGKVGADVYSIGKDGKGKKQQVVRSLAEQVANPQTIAQMRGRMIMSTVMQAVSALRPIIDHSFDGIAKGQPSISEFIRRNYALIKADVEAHPATGNKFGLVKYQEKGARGGAYVVSDGSAAWPSSIENNYSGAKIMFPTTATTAGAIRAALGLAVGDYITIVGIGANGQGQFARFIVSEELADDTTITQNNVSSLIKFEGNVTPTYQFVQEEGYCIVTFDEVSTSLACNAILSVKDGSEWTHTKCVLDAVDKTYTADVALPTYPVGEEQFLNGGEL